jgi:hypothetical protein
VCYLEAVRTTALGIAVALTLGTAIGHHEAVDRADLPGLQADIPSHPTSYGCDA